MGRAADKANQKVMPDKYTATWVSHSSVGDFLKCPRAYYLKNVYKNPQTGRKISVVAPPLSLGQAVHEVLEGLLLLPAERRFDVPLGEKFEDVWEDVKGEKGGFSDEREEAEAKLRGARMMERVTKNPGPLANKAIRINQDLPYYFLSEEDNIILCGKIDWLEYVPNNDSVHVLDFKTGRGQEKEDSLQLPIYSLLLENCQKRRVSGASYWYLDRDDEPTEVALPELDEAHGRVMKVAQEIRQAREEQIFTCPRGDDGCFSCGSLEAVLAGKGKMVGVGLYDRELYVLL